MINCLVLYCIVSIPVSFLIGWHFRRANKRYEDMNNEPKQD